MNKPELHLVECDCDCADACPQGRSGIDFKCRIKMRAEADLPTSTLFEHGDYRVIVGEHPDHGHVYLAVGNGKGTTAMLCEAAMALTIAGAIVTAAAKAIEQQFQRQLGQQ